MFEIFQMIGDLFSGIFSLLFRYGFSFNGVFISIGAVLISCAIVSFIIFSFWRGAQH